MDRRSYLTVAGTATAVALAGCTDSDPEPEPVELVQPSPSLVSLNSDQDAYYGTIRNDGVSGQIRTELYYFQDETVPNPDVSALFEQETHPGREFDTAVTEQFEADEEKEITFEPTADNPWNEYGLIPLTASYGAIIENTGGAGDVNVRLEFVDKSGFDLEEPEQKTVEMDSNDEITVMFDLVIPGGVEYEIATSPA